MNHDVGRLALEATWRKNFDMAEKGYLYIPPSCRQAGISCRVHIALHGCKQNAKDFANKLKRALLDAAIELHPGWRMNADHSASKLDASAPENDALIDWLYVQHPEELCR